MISSVVLLPILLIQEGPWTSTCYLVRGLSSCDVIRSFMNINEIQRIVHSSQTSDVYIYKFGTNGIFDGIFSISFTVMSSSCLKQLRVK